MLEKMKLLLNITDDEKDELLTLLIDQATEYAINYTHNEDITVLAPIILKLAIYDYNRTTTLGLDSEGYSGVSFSYSADYPEDILRILRTKRRIITL